MYLLGRGSPVESALSASVGERLAFQPAGSARTAAETPPCVSSKALPGGHPGQGFPVTREPLSFALSSAPQVVFLKPLGACVLTHRKWGSEVGTGSGDFGT